MEPRTLKSQGRFDYPAAGRGARPQLQCQGNAERTPA